MTKLWRLKGLEFIFLLIQDTKQKKVSQINQKKVVVTKCFDIVRRSWKKQTEKLLREKDNKTIEFNSERERVYRRTLACEKHEYVLHTMKEETGKWSGCTTQK